MSDLIAVHGGLEKPVSCSVSPDEVGEFRAEAAGLTKISITDADLSTVYRFGDGTLSPLKGPMDEATYERVLDESVVEHEGSLYAWTIPLSLPVATSVAASLAAGDRAALHDSSGALVAILNVGDVFEWNKMRYLTSVYGTERSDHPGADMVLKKGDAKDDADMTHLVGGSLRVLPQRVRPAFEKYVLRPEQIRALLAEHGWDRVVAFQTRNPLHRAHEYALIYGLETLLRAGHNAGACLNPLIGETKGDDVNAEIRMRTYETLINGGEMGQGDSDAELWATVGGAVPDRVILLGLDIKMFYGGPKEAVMHAIYRQNCGFTDIVIGRKHADAPYHDGSAIWGDFDAQEIFDNLSGDLKIKPLKVGFAAYYESLGRVDLMENHKEEKPVFISGKQVRATLQKGEAVDPRIMRESTSKILAEAMSSS